MNNKDQVTGKVKDVAGRIERQAGEWTGDKEKEGNGASKQVDESCRMPGPTRKTSEEGQPTRSRRGTTSSSTARGK